MPLKLKYLEITGLDPRKDKKLSCVQLEDLPDEIKVKIWLLRNNGIQASFSDDPWVPVFTTAI